jgi:hypothetical protein
MRVAPYFSADPRPDPPLSLTGPTMLPKAALASLSALALVLPTWLTLAQDPVTPPPENPPEIPAETPDAEKPDPNVWSLDEKWHGLYGAWQLMQYDHVTEVVPNDSIRGFATFQEGFMTLIVHARSFDEDEEQLGQAGLQRYQMVEPNILQTATMMGHSNIGPDAEFEWESPNIPREFKVYLNKDDLTLTRPDQSQLIFRRIKPAPYPALATELIKEARAGLGD